MLKQLHIKSWLLALCLVLGVGNAWADEVTLTYSGETTNMTNDNNAASLGVSATDWTVTAIKGTGSNLPGLNKDGSIRLYAGGNGFTVAAADESTTIESINVTYTGTSYNGATVTVNGSTINENSGVFEIGANSFTITNNKTTGQIRFSSIKITYTTGGNPTVAPPTFSPAGGTYAEAQDVTISCSTDGAAISYSTDGTNWNTYSDAIHVSETTTIQAKATKEGYNESAVASATYTIEAPTTIAVARAQATGSVFTKGVVTSCVSTTAYIQDATAAICVYGQSLTVGDEITVSGTLSNYNGLLEITNPSVTVLSSGNTVAPTVKTIAEINADYAADNALQGWLVKIEEATVTIISGSNTTIAQGENTIVVRGISGVEYKVDDILTLEGNIGCYNAAQIANPTNVVVQANEDPVINAADVTIAYDATSGSIAYNITNPVEGTSLTATTTADWISNITVGESTVTFTTTANGGTEDRTATITLSYNGAESKTVTVTQGHYEEVVDYATLPFEFNGGRDDIKNTNGLTQEGLDTDYGSSPKLKFNTTDDYLVLKFNEQPGTLTFDIKGNSFSGGTFTVQTSVDGVTYTDLKSYTTLGNTQSETFDNLAADVRYIKWVYTEKSSGNVALGNIKLAQYVEVVKYSINIDENIENGTVTADKVEAAEGATVTLTVTPDTGYILDALTVSGASGEVEVSEDNTFTMPAEAVTVTATFKQPVGVTYTLATAITSGKHYIITNGTDKAMGEQKSNNRGAVDVTIADGTGTATVEEGSGVYEVVICGPDANGFYTIYDAKTSGYLYAASSSSNYLRSKTPADANGTWSIEFDAEGVATIKAQGDNTRNWMRYNTSGMFACYASGQNNIYLYEKDGEDTPAADYTRSVTSGNYGTICLPNTATITGAKLFKITGKTMNEEELVSVNIEEVKGTAVAGTPYIFQATDATLGAWYTGEAADAKSDNGLVGTYVRTAIPRGMYVLKDNKVYFVDKEEYVYSGANKAYIDLTNVKETSGTESSVKLYNGDAETGIAQIDTDINDVVIYNLAGQRVSKTTKGIYIINGKKVLK